MLALAGLAAPAWADDAAEVAGKAVLAEGAVTATTAAGAARALHDGDTIYAGDTITTRAGGYASLDFEDGAEVVLRPSSSFQIRQYHFEPAAHDDNGNDVPLAADQPAVHESAFFSLLKGGFRAVSGLIGHVQRQDYELQTPTATIGIRGTAYDVRYCQDDCSDEADGGKAPDNGLYTNVGKGAIALKNDAGESLTSAGQSAHVAGRGVLIRRLSRAPSALRHMELPQRFHQRAERMRQRVRTERTQRFRQRRQAVHGGALSHREGSHRDNSRPGNGRQENGRTAAGHLPSRREQHAATGPGGRREAGRAAAAPPANRFLGRRQAAAPQGRQSAPAPADRRRFFDPRRRQSDQR